MLANKPNVWSSGRRREIDVVAGEGTLQQLLPAVHVGKIPTSLCYLPQTEGCLLKGSSARRKGSTSELDLALRDRKP
jgi:hypothetical protein